MFDENVSQLIIRGNTKYIITGDGYSEKKKITGDDFVHEKRQYGQFKLHLTYHNEVV